MKERGGGFKPIMKKKGRYWESIIQALTLSKRKSGIKFSIEVPTISQFNRYYKFDKQQIFATPIWKAVTRVFKRKEKVRENNLLISNAFLNLFQHAA